MTDVRDRKVVIEKVRVHGFGPHRGAVTAEFPEGLGVLALPNERGKSTLAQAVVALLFGLPHTSDEKAFGTARFRNARQPTRFEGEIVLRASGTRYRLVRNFDNHKIALAEEERGGFRRRAAGEHNPNARRPNPAYEAWLVDVLGIASRPLFEATFFVGQPLPLPDQLDSQIQGLLAGGRGRGGQAALEALAEAARELTRYTSALGVTSRDGRKEGRIEQVEAEIASLSESMEASRAALEGLATVSAELAERAREIAALGARLAEVEAELAAVDGWLAAAKSARERGEEVAKLRRALSVARKCEGELHNCAARLAEEFPEFDGDGARLGDALLRLRDLSRALEELGRLRREQAEIRDRCAGVRRFQEVCIDWDLGGAGAADWVRAFKAAFAKAREEWSRLAAIRRGLEEVRRTRAASFSAFEEAAPSALDEVATYPNRRSELERELEAAVRSAAEAEERLQSAAAARRSLDERYARVAGRAGDLASVEELAGIRGGKARIAEELLAPSRALKMLGRARAAAGAAAVALGALAAFSLAGDPGAAGPDGVGLPPGGAAQAALGALLAAFALLGAKLPPFSRFERERRKLEKTLRDLEEKERSLLDGRLSWIGATPLDAVRSELLAYREALDVLGAQAAADAERLSAAKARAEECRRRLNAFDARMREMYGSDRDLHEAFRAWRGLVDEERRKLDSAAELLEAWGVPVDRGGGEEPGRAGGDLFEQTEACDPAALHEPWRQLAAFLGKVAGSRLEIARVEAPVCLADAVRLLDGLDEAFWRELERRAGEYDRAAREFLQLELRLASIEQDELPRRRESAGAILASLEKDFPGDWSGLRALVDGELEGGAPSLAEGVPAPVARALAAGGGSADGAWERFQAWKDLAEQSDRLKDSLASTLAASGAATVAELEERLAVGEGRLGLALAEMEAYAKQDPSLPADPGADFEGVVRRAARLRTDLAEVKKRIESLEEARLELLRRQAELQGQRPLNVAVAAERLKELVAERERLRLEAEAVALAHAELSRAVDDYYSDHVGRLAHAAGERFANLSGRPGRRVALSDKLEVGVVEPDGTPIDVRQLSLGAQDLLYISLRLAVADLMAGGRALPFVFDDPFVNFDAERLGRMRECLISLAAERQVILLTHREELRAFGEEIAIEVEEEAP